MKPPTEAVLRIILGRNWGRTDVPQAPRPSHEHDSRDEGIELHSAAPISRDLGERRELGVEAKL
jgi:hypothetical protein